MAYIAEKRFPATPKKKQEARKKGQILKSQELTSAVMLLAIVGLLKIWLPNVFQRLANIFTYAANLSGDWNLQSLWKVFIDVSWQFLLILAPVFAAALVIAFAVNMLQTGPVLITEPLIPKFSRMNPIEGAKRMFGLKALVNLIKSLIQSAGIGYFLIDVIRKNMDVFPVLQGAEVGQSVIFLSGLLFEMAWKIALAFLVIAFADFLYQWWEYEKNLRMSQEEIKEEYKQTEGDPLIKSQIKKRQRMMAMRRMMEDLKQADVVITNPTHYAVALKYDAAKYPAPYVVAKGQNEIALRIRQIAEENHIVIMENKPLARSLYSQVELGQVVPWELYKAVAEVLAFVFRLNKKRRSYSA